MTPVFVLTVTSSERTAETLSWFEFSHYREAARAPLAVAAEGMSFGGLVFESASGARVVDARVASAGYLAALGVKPLLGRDFEPSDDRRPEVTAILGHRLWRNLGGEPALVGSVVRLGNRPITIIGVAEASLWGTNLDRPDDLWISLGAATVFGSWRESQLFDEALKPAGGTYRWLKTIVRLRERAADSLAGAVAEATTFIERAGLVSLAASAYPSESRAVARRLMQALSGLAWLLVAVAAMNLAGLHLIHIAGQQLELFIRRALGAGSLHLLGVLMSLPWTVALLGSLFGTLVAAATVGILRQVELPGNVTVSELSLRVDGSSVARGFGVALILTCLMTAVGAAWYRAGRRRSLTVPSMGRTAPLRHLHLVILGLQIAFAVLATTSAWYLAGNVRRALRSDIGFANKDAIFFTVRSDAFRGRSQDFQLTLSEQLTAAFQRVPGVRSAAFGRTVFGPDIGTTGWRVFLDGSGFNVAEPYLIRTIGPEYLATVGVAVRRGRDIADTDRQGAPLAAVVTDSFARQIWHTTDGVGRRLGLPGYGTVEVIGVIADPVREGLGRPTRPTIFVPVAQHPSSARVLDYVVAADGATDDFMRRLQQAMVAILPDAQLSNVRTPRQVLGRQIADERLAAVVAATFSVVILVMCSAGLFALVRLSIAERRPEIGIRLALGQSPSGVRRQFVWEGGSAAGVGCLLGGLAWVWAGPLVQRLVLHPDGHAAAALGYAVLVVGSVALLVCYAAAGQAARVDPTQLLRQQ